MPKPDISNSVNAAKDLLGWKLVHESEAGRTSGYIVETEAYDSADEASHSFRGETTRTAVMFGPAGKLYVYFSYGMHYCMNIVTGPEGDGQAVLIRALEPCEGIDLMTKRRGNKSNLANGPARLTQAMGIDLSFNGGDVLSGSKVWIEPGFEPEAITETTRIGISKAKDKLWRFYISGNPHISKR